MVYKVFPWVPTKISIPYRMYYNFETALISLMVIEEKKMLLAVGLVRYCQNKLKDSAAVLLACRSIIKPHLNLYWGQVQFDP